jgi:hypothetical protein
MGENTYVTLMLGSSPTLHLLTSISGSAELTVSNQLPSLISIQIVELHLVRLQVFSMASNFEKTENHAAQSLKERPDSTKAFSKELHDMQRCETPSAFKQDMGKMNDDLHKQGLLPGLQIVENEKSHDFELKKMGDAKTQGTNAKGSPTAGRNEVEHGDQAKHGGGDRQSMVEGAQKTLADPKASAADKLSTVENLSKNGVKNIQVADSDGKMRDYSIESQKSGKREMVHLYGKDDNGQSQIALRGIDNGDGTFSQEKDKHGRNSGYEGSNWVESGHGKSNVGTVSDVQKTTPVGPDSTPTRSAQPSDGTTPEKAVPSGSPERAPGSIDRSQFDSQLNDPKVMAAFAGRMNSEVGSQGPAAQTAFAEEVMNRAASRNQTLMQALSGSYYPTSHPGSSHNPQYVGAITNAWKNGSDTTHGATGNASGRVGFGAPGGHYDGEHKWVSTNQTANIGGERFGHEQVDINKGWLDKYESLKRYS